MRILLIMIAISYSGLSFAQEDTYKKVAQETCDCISKIDLSGATVNSIQTSLGLCMLESIKNNKIEIEISDAVAMRDFGEQVGIQMAPICPEVFSFLSEEVARDEAGTPDLISISGQIKSIDEKEFIYFVLKENSGKETRLIWLRYFKGSDDYLEKPKTLVGKNVRIKYRPIDLYLPKANGYFAYKEIVELELN